MKTVMIIGTCETTEDRIVTTRLAFPAATGLHEDRPALTGVIVENMRKQLPEGVDLLPDTLAIVQSRIG